MRRLVPLARLPPFQFPSPFSRRAQDAAVLAFCIGRMQYYVKQDGTPMCETVRLNLIVSVCRKCPVLPSRVSSSFLLP
jgi:hypothetical protein